ncbi:hypothetical protein BH11PLA2_BH11PLA2_19670 [soil metagenome]
MRASSMRRLAGPSMPKSRGVVVVTQWITSAIQNVLKRHFRERLRGPGNR